MDDQANDIGEIEITDILKMLPHRYPFLMIDRVSQVVLDDSAVGLKNVTVNEPFFPGHFPGHPIMPGVMIIEAMAQTAAVLVMKTLGKQAEGALVYFMSVDGGRFRKPVVPGDTVHLHVKKIQNRRNVWKFKGEAKVGDVVKAEATFAAMIVEAGS